MKKLVTVTNKEIIDSLKNEDDITLLYPLKNYTVGYTVDFNIDEINGYCLVNRILTDSELDKLDTILHNSNIKGIVFDDLGIIDIIKDLDIKKILMLDHLATNTKSINYYLEYVDSVIVSNDLALSEIKDIVNNTKRSVVVNVFGLKTLMYSRRKLLSNYEEYHKLDKEDIINATIEEKHFKIIENEYGTKFYAYPYYSALELLDLKNVLYFWYDPILLESNKIINLVLNNDISNIETTRLFLDEKTIYKVGDINA